MVFKVASQKGGRAAEHGENSKPVLLAIQRRFFDGKIKKPHEKYREVIRVLKCEIG
jgi:hypothetical protein